MRFCVAAATLAGLRAGELTAWLELYRAALIWRLLYRVAYMKAPIYRRLYGGSYIEAPGWAPIDLLLYGSSYTEPPIWRLLYRSTWLGLGELPGFAKTPAMS